MRREGRNSQQLHKGTSNSNNNNNKVRHSKLAIPASRWAISLSRSLDSMVTLRRSSVPVHMDQTPPSNLCNNKPRRRVHRAMLQASAPASLLCRCSLDAATRARRPSRRLQWPQLRRLLHHHEAARPTVKQPSTPRARFHPRHLAIPCIPQRRHPAYRFLLWATLIWPPLPTRPVSHCQVVHPSMRTLLGPKLRWAASCRKHNRPCRCSER